VGVIRPFLELLLSYRHSRRLWDPKETLLGRDRRLFERVRVESVCRLDNRLFGLQSDGVLVNMSLGGAGVVAPVSWPEGSRVRFRVEAHQFEVDGVIVFRQVKANESGDECRYGVKFQQLGWMDVWRLRRILKSNHSGSLAVL